MAQAPPKQRNLGRLTEIAQVAVRHGFGYFFERHKLTDLIPGRRNGTELLEGSASERGKHLRELLDELGPTFVKFGQLLSMRPDVLPPDIITELRGLQDDVRPFPYEEVERVILEDLGLPIERLFLEFDREPLAAASIGQVHRAVLPNGHVVAVKVQRPGAPEQIEADLGLLYQAARIAKERVRALDFVDVREVVDEFARAIRQELDYRLEGRNADTLHRNFAGPPARARPARLLDVHARARPDARVHRGPPARRRRRGAVLGRGAEAPRGGDRRGLDDDGLPGRLLPRRPAPGEHPRHPPRPDRARRLRARRASSPTTT